MSPVGQLKLKRNAGFPTQANAYERKKKKKRKNEK